MPRIALIPGDGIGRDVLEQASRVLARISDLFRLDYELVEWDLGAELYLKRGVAITDEEFRALSDDHDAILMGALGDPRVPGNEHARHILLGLRFGLDLYVNYRPCHLLHPSLCKLAGPTSRTIRLDIFRENTEGLYSEPGESSNVGADTEIAIQKQVNTHRGVERIVRAAFQFAAERGAERVTLVDKANALPVAGALWRRVFDEVGEEHPDTARESRYVDAMAMDLVRCPERYHVIVTGNLFGDILSDLAAEITGGLGLAPSANLHPGRHALFEPVHGSAPDIAGQGRANPVGAIRCVALLLDHFGQRGAASVVERAVLASITRGIRTPDLGGSHSTESVGRWITDALSIDPDDSTG